MKDFFNLENHTKTVMLIFLIIIICIIFYLVKNFKTIDIQLKILLMIVGLIAGICMSKEDDKNLALLRNDFSLTTGSIEEYIVPNLKGYKGSTSNSINYTCKVGNEFIRHSYYENYFISIPNDKPDLNILYLVIYEKKNPRNSFILLNYPVNSSDNFNRYVEMFKNEIPANAFKHN